MDNADNHLENNMKRLFAATTPNMKLSPEKKQAILKKLLQIHVAGDARKRSQPILTRIVMASPLPRLAAAIIIILAVFYFITIFGKSKHSEPKSETDQQLQRMAAADSLPESGLASKNSGQFKPSNSQMIASYLTSTATPGPNEVCLDTNLLGQRRILRMPRHGWIGIGKGLFFDLRQCPKGKYLAFKQEEAFVYVSVDGGPFRLAGVRFHTRNDLEDLHMALLESVSPLILWCDIQPPTDISELPNLERITSFQQVNPKLLSDLTPIAHLTNLVSVYIKHRHQTSLQITDVSPLSNLKNLEVLILSECHNVCHISDLAPALTYLELSGAINLTDLRPLAKLAKLTHLVLNNDHRITDISPITSLSNLIHLDLHYCYEISDITPLMNLVNLKFLDLRGCSEITEFWVIEDLTNLQHLELGACNGLADLFPLANIVSLGHLNLSYCQRITDLSPLANLTNLTALDLSNCPSIHDLSPLQHLSNLRTISLRNCDGIEDLSPLQDGIARGANVVVDQRLWPQLEGLCTFDQE